MTEKIIIEIGKDGRMKAELENFRAEDPACFNFQKILNINKDAGVDIDHIHMDDRTHGHHHEFAQRKEHTH